MTVSQIYELMNGVTAEILGESAVVQEDLSNVVDLGTQIFNATDVDNYVRTLVNHIGKVIFVNRPYVGTMPSMLRDAWEFGSVLEKITAELPDAEENESWELTDGASYDVNVFRKPHVSTKFFNNRVTFEIQVSFTDRQVKESFSSAAQLNGFVSMIYNAVDKSMNVKTDSLISRTLNTMIAETIHDDFGSAQLSSKSGIKAVNLLYLYNTTYGLTSSNALTVDKALYTPEFLRFAALQMSVYAGRLSKLSKLFNVGGTDKFTPASMLHVVLLDQFAAGADVYLQSDTFHDNFTALPKHETVPYWQGSGTGYAFSDVSKINVKTADNNTVSASGILGVMFDHDSCGVTNLSRRVTAQYNAKAEFTNNWFKFDAGYFGDLNENFVVFLIA